jgi:hypothetical protein
VSGTPREAGCSRETEQGLSKTNSRGPEAGDRPAETREQAVRIGRESFRRTGESAEAATGPQHLESNNLASCRDEPGFRTPGRVARFRNTNIMLSMIAQTCNPST